MTATPYDSPAWRGVFHDTDLSPLFTDTAELRANLLVMGTLALTQAKAGLIPEVSAKAIQRAAMEVQIDPAALAPEIAASGDAVAALVAQFKAEMQAPEHATWVHHDSDPHLTSATGLSLRLRQSLKIIWGRLDKTEIPPLAAYHSDRAIRAGLAEGLGLHDLGEQDPHDAIRAIGDQIATIAAALPAGDTTAAAIKHQLPHLNATLQSAPKGTETLITLMTLPQMVLGLGRLVN